MNADDESPREGGQQLHAELLTDEQKLWRQLIVKPCAASNSPGSASLVLILPREPHAVGKAISAALAAS
jgi:hypothetical protein